MRVKAIKCGIFFLYFTGADSCRIFLPLFLSTRSLQSSRSFTRASSHSLDLSRWVVGVRKCVWGGKGNAVRANHVGDHPSLSNCLTLMPLGEMHSYVSS